MRRMLQICPLLTVLAAAALIIFSDDATRLGHAAELSRRDTVEEVLRARLKLLGDGAGEDA